MSVHSGEAFGAAMRDMSDSIREVTARPTVQIYLPDGRVLEGPRGTQAVVFMAGESREPNQIVGAIINSELRELTYPIEMDARLTPVTLNEPDGMRIYRRSLTFLLAAAFEPLFPEARLTVDHSVSSGGYYCQVARHQPLSSAELAQLEAEMKRLVEADLPFAKLQVPLDEAIAYFAAKGYKDKVRLLSHRRKPHMVLYQLCDFRDYHHGYMLPSTGYLTSFALEKTDDGFTLRFPRRHSPHELQPLPAYPKLLATFRQYGDWLETLGIAGVGALNDAIVNGRAKELILVSEALHEGRIAEIAGMIARRTDKTRLVLIAGPSASGKTTFSKRLSVQLLALGLSPFPIELDGFFVDREKTPRDDSGEFDYESLYALDLDRLNHDLKLLIAGKDVRLPHYNFVKGRQEQGDMARLAATQVVILEGIHGLNPELVPEIAPDLTFRIYASALTQLNLDRHNRVSTTDTRLIRRIVRDAAQRGYSASDTIGRWESVRRGEKRYIFPYQENADVMFNSALVYEVATLAPLAAPLIRQVPYGTPEHVEAKRLLAFLEWFLPIDSQLVPDNSIMREFLGGSILQTFTPWTAPPDTG
jgi:uridine kinase